MEEVKDGRLLYIFILLYYTAYAAIGKKAHNNSRSKYRMPWSAVTVTAYDFCLNRDVAQHNIKASVDYVCGDILITVGDARSSECDCDVLLRARCYAVAVFLFFAALCVKLSDFESLFYLVDNTDRGRVYLIFCSCHSLTQHRRTAPVWSEIIASNIRSTVRSRNHNTAFSHALRIGALVWACGFRL